MVLWEVNRKGSIYSHSLFTGEIGFRGKYCPDVETFLNTGQKIKFQFYILMIRSLKNK